MDDPVTCGKCEERPGDVHCSCGERFCEPCFTEKHMTRNPSHSRGSQKEDMAWKWISGELSWQNLDNPGHLFKEDEQAKWFGVEIKDIATPRGWNRVVHIVETFRLTSLMEESIHLSENSPKRQFPSLASFIGETGAGKSTIIRSLIYHSKSDPDVKHLEAPMPGDSKGFSAVMSTTGEVNLYKDPSTFGTTVPRFFVDCEGLRGIEPLATQHQRDWSRYGRKYHMRNDGDEPIDRHTAVKEVYPRFLYLFSDVICYVTSNNKSWGDCALQLLKWSKIGAQKTIQQTALPALIIILNGSRVENETWMSSDLDAMTRDFFRAVDNEVNQNAVLRIMASKHRDKTMKQLLARSFSSVHVHFIPQAGSGKLGTSSGIAEQTQRLSRRIKQDTERVQTERQKFWSRFDTTQMPLFMHFAFKHLAENRKSPFNFGEFRHKVEIPTTIEANISEFLGYCLDDDMENRFYASSAVLASCLLRNSLAAEGKGLGLHPSVIFSKEIQDVCKRAMEDFLAETATCAYIDPDSNEKCANTKSGHAQGHQSISGEQLQDGLFVHSNFDPDEYLGCVEICLRDMMDKINAYASSNHREWRRAAAILHRRNVKNLRDRGGFPRATPTSFEHDTLETSVCYGCLFHRPEYRLPCGHVICAICLKDFDGTDPAIRTPGFYTHRDCIICGDSDEKIWPYRVQVRPDLAGIRVLSLDGGGVRGILELITLRRLEELVGLELPLGRFFDIIVGTSAGGLIALGLGVQGRHVRDCIGQFHTICKSGFKAKIGTKTTLFGWLARFISRSIYRTENMEDALRESFGRQPKTVYGLTNSCRVAVTTTINSPPVLRLIANYNRGGAGKYLNSELPVWKAARCTSAAPMYFEPVNHGKDLCRDGGLKENNPVQTAVNEVKTIWGEKVAFDLVLSVGSGYAPHPQKHPRSTFVIPQWLSILLNTLLSTMNGEDAWKRYKESLDDHGRMNDRSSHLNIRLQGDHEPQLDDLTAISKMGTLAEKYNFFEPMRQTQHSSILDSLPGVDGQPSQLELLADRLRASLYFFELGSFFQHEDVSVVRGYICCRLEPQEDAFSILIEKTASFNVNGKVFQISQERHQNQVLMEVELQQQSLSTPIRIDVNFIGQRHWVSVSGFPMTVGALKEYWDQQPGDFESTADVDPKSVAVNFQSLEISAADMESRAVTPETTSLRTFLKHATSDR